MDKSMLQKWAVTAFLLALAVSVTFAAPEQDQRQQNQRGQDAAGGWFGGFDREAMQERLLNIYKEKLGITDEEWSVLLPRLKKVQELNQKITEMQAMMQWNVLLRPQFDAMMKQNENDNPWAGMMRGFFDQMRQEQEAQVKRALEQGDTIQIALTELQETLAKPAPSAAEIKNKMMAFRGAKEKLRQELMQAQQELREVLTLKQEALLLMLGILE